MIIEDEPVVSPQLPIVIPQSLSITSSLKQQRAFRSFVYSKDVKTKHYRVL